MTTCPACAALVRPDDQWCTLCYTSLVAPVAEPAQQPDPVDGSLHDDDESRGQTYVGRRHRGDGADPDAETDTEAGADPGVAPDGDVDADLALDLQLAALRSEAHAGFDLREVTPVAKAVFTFVATMSLLAAILLVLTVVGLLMG